MAIPQIAAGVNAGDIMEALLLKGDLGKLTPEERVIYYNKLCASLGLNPLTQPFEYMTLNGKLRLYAKRDAADQLRKLNGISVKIVSQEIANDTLTIHVHAIDRDGREDEDLGVVPFPSTLKGELRANQVMKAVTKGKRRVTLSLAGLGFLDETEVADIPRENPHTDREGEIKETVPENDPDYLPAAEGMVARVEDQRKDYDALVKEMHKIKDPVELQQWGGTVAKERMGSYQKKWQQIFRREYWEYLQSLRGLKNALVESALTDLDNAYENCEDAAGFFEVDRNNYQPLLQKLSPEDQQRAGEIRARHMARFAEP